MARFKVDIPSLQMVLVFTANVVIVFWDSTAVAPFVFYGEFLIVAGALLFVYVLAHLRRGFFGETEPVLDHLITDGPYRFCRHPLYLSFIILILGVDLMFGSILGVTFTLFLSIPSAFYRARVEDRLLKEKFGELWVRYARRVGFFLPRLFGKNAYDNA